MRIWLRKLWVKVVWFLHDMVDIRPFLSIDPNDYCPACGNRQGKIKADTDGKIVAVRHICSVCSWEWHVETVTIIPTDNIIPIPKDDEFDQMVADTKNVRQPNMLINGRPGVN